MASKGTKASAFANSAVVAKATLAKSAATADKRAGKKTNTGTYRKPSQKSDSNSKVMIRVSRQNEAALEQMPNWLDAEFFGSTTTLSDVLSGIADSFRKKQKRFRNVVDSISRRSARQKLSEYPFLWASVGLLAGALFLTIVVAVFTILSIV